MLQALAIALVAAAGQPSFEREIARAVEDVAHVYRVPNALVRAIIRQESGFNPRARSRSGAIGLMQLMPYNAQFVGLREADLWDPEKNILAGTRLLAVLLEYYQGDLISALTAYNSGPKRPGAHIPNNGETPAYVWRVLAFFQSYQGASSHRP